MSVIEKNKIDAIAITKDEKGIKLLITDHLEWIDEYRHLLILQSKINDYIMFWESEQYKEIYKDIQIAYGVIEIQFLFSPTKKAIEFLHVIQNTVSCIGISIEYYVSEENS